MPNFTNIYKIISSYNIKYPYAKHKETNQPIHISAVTKNNKHSLTCPDCNEILTPVLKHQTPHFRHKSNSNCSTNPESYIHWLAKKAFKNMKEIHFPPLYIYQLSDISVPHRQKLDNLINDLVTKQIPYPAHKNYNELRKNNLSEKITLQIQKIETEKTYKTSLGDVRIDVVLTIENQEVFIEPYYTNPISKDKLEKLRELNIPTLSIPLCHFLDNYPDTFTLQDLTEYIQLDRTKYWSLIRPKSLDTYIEDYILYLQQQINYNQTAYLNMEKNLKIIDDLYSISSDISLIIAQHTKEKKSVINYIDYIKNNPSKYFNKHKVLEKFTK
jgi:hypothetical protein